jgi:hypothetical protein
MVKREKLRDYFTTAEAAKYLNRPMHWLWNKARRFKGCEPLRVGSKTVLWHRSTLDALKAKTDGR